MESGGFFSLLATSVRSLTSSFLICETTWINEPFFHTPSIINPHMCTLYTTFDYLIYVRIDYYRNGLIIGTEKVKIHLPM